MECGSVHRGHVVAISGFYCGSFGFLVDVVS